MANSLFDNKNLGKYPRRYDQVSEESGVVDDKEIVADLLQWMKIEGKGASKLDPDKKNKDIIEMVESGIKLGGLDKVSAISQMQSASMHKHLRTGARKVVDDLYYGAKDLLSRRRVKTTLTVIGGIAVGVAIGVVLGTVVFPGIGSAIGGVIGGLISGGLAAVGGAVGLGILGGVVGSWLGNKISKRFFKEERHYELSKKVTSKVKSQYGISGKTSQMMSAYLYNRRMAVKSPLCQRYYRMLRKNAIKQADHVAIEKLAYFFCQELKLLNIELEADKDNDSLYEDRRAVLHILRQLKNAEGLPFQTRKYIQETLENKPEKVELPPARMVVNNKEVSVQNAKKGARKSAPVGLGLAQPRTSVPVTQETMTQVNRRFDENLRKSKLDIKEVVAEHHRPESRNNSYYKYHITRNNKPDLPDILFREVKISANQYSAEVLVDKAALDAENQEVVSEVLVAQARALYESSGNKYLKVVADKDDALAVNLMAAALKANMAPELDEKEYPMDTTKALEKRKDILAQAYELAGMSPPPEPKRVGFRVDFDR